MTTLQRPNRFSKNFATKPPATTCGARNRGRTPFAATLPSSSRWAGKKDIPDKKGDDELLIGLQHGLANQARRLLYSPSDGTLVLQVAGDTFRASPSYLAESIGHELIHAEQLVRPRKQPTTNFEATVDALLELEAYSWGSASLA